MRFGQATESDESSAEVGTPNFGRSCSREEDALFPDAKVGTPKAEVGEVAAAEEDAATVGQAIAIESAAENVAEPKEGAAAEEDAAAQPVAALLGRDERLAIPTSWRRDSVAPRCGSGKGGGRKMGTVEDSEAAERLKILKVPKCSAD